MPTYTAKVEGAEVTLDTPSEMTREELWPLFYAKAQQQKAAASQTEQGIVASMAETPATPSGTRKVMAIGAGMALRGAGTAIGAIAGTSLGPAGTIAGGALGAGATEGPARLLEDMIMGRPNVPPTALETTAAMVGGAAGAGLGPAGGGMRFVQGAKVGAISGGSENASRQIAEGRLDPAELAQSAIFSGFLGGVANRVLGQRPVEAAKKSLLSPVTKAEVEATKAAQEASGAPAGMKERKLITSAKASPEFDDPLKGMLESYYKPQSNAETITRVSKTIEDLGLPGARLAFDGQKEASAEGSALGLELARRYQAKGDHGDAAYVLHQLAQRATTQGQAIQILSTLSRQTPEGMALFATKIKGEALTGAEATRVAQMAKDIANAQNETVRIARTAKAFGEMSDAFNPATAGQKTRAAFNLAMLLNPKTQVRNSLGNIFMAGMEIGKDAIAVPLDSGMSVFTGNRTVYGPQIAERLKGLKAPVEEFMAGFNQARSEGQSMGKALSEGVDTVAIMAKLQGSSKMETGDLVGLYKNTFSSPVAKGAERALSVTMGAPDRAFFMSAYKASLKNLTMAAEAAKAAGKEAMDPADIHAVAHLQAAEAVFQNENFISKSLNKLREALNEATTGGKSKTIGLGQAITPFTQVPGAILQQGIKYSPAGYVRGLYHFVAPVLMETQFDQRKFVDAMAKASMGTGALFGTGAVLHKLGAAQGLPDADPDIEAMRKMAGVGGYTINASVLKRRLLAMDFNPGSPLGKAQPGDALVSYDWIQPAAIPFAMGVEVSSKAAKLTDKGKNADLIATGGILAGLRTLESQPLLSGFSRFFNSARASGSYSMAAGEAVLSLPTQAIPVIGTQVGGVTNPEAAETRGGTPLEQAYNASLSRLPGVAKAMGFPPKYDTLGRAVEKYGDALIPSIWFNSFLNPATMKELKANPIAAEVTRLYESTGRTDAAPRTMQKTVQVTVNKKPVTLELNSQEISDMQYLVGRTTNDVFMQAIASPAYHKMSDDERAKTLSNLVSDVMTAAKIVRLGHRPNAMPPKNSAAAIMIMSMDPSMSRLWSFPETGAKAPAVKERL